MTRNLVAALTTLALFGCSSSATPVTSSQDVMTSSSNYAHARIATLYVVQALYGSGSPQHSAVSAA